MKHTTIFCLVILGVTGCGHYPRPIHSASSIRWAPASEYMVVIVNLPLEDWPKLKKFVGLEHLRISNKAADQVTDDHLKALSLLNLSKLRDVSFANCHRVTDKGIEALAKLPAISSLQLIGVGMTDNGMLTLATQFKQLKGINVTECPRLTSDGFLSLTNSRTITAVGLSIGNLSQQQLEHLISGVTNVTWWTIKDPQGTLNLDSLRRLGIARNLTIQREDASNSVTGITRREP